MAVDVAAMSTDGGVIIYGVDEDKATGTFTPTTFPLAGFKDRISEVVASKVARLLVSRLLPTIRPNGFPDPLELQ